MILKPVPSAFKFFGIFFENSHLMGIHQLPKAHPQRTIQSAVMSPCLFQHGNILFHLPLFISQNHLLIVFQRIVSLAMRSLQNENIISELNHEYCTKGLLCSVFLQSSLMYLECECKI